MRKHALLSFGFLFVSAFSAFAMRPAEVRKMERKAENHYVFSEYEEALPIFMKLSEKDPSNPKYCFRIGICYYYSATSRPLSVPYFERALRLPGMEKDADLYLHAGLAYLSVNRFADARACFELFRAQGDDLYDPAIAIRLLANCDNGEKAWAAPGRVRVRNLGKNVNSIYPDYAPVITPDQSQLLFTSKRPGTTGGRRDEDGHYYEDIYVCKNLASRRWAESGRYDTSYLAPKFGPFRFFFARAENVSEINTNDHDGSIAICSSGKNEENNLYIYRYGDIWKAGWNGKRWEKPQRIQKDVDAKSSMEPSLCFSADGNIMYFVSDRSGGMGGKDIWMCTRQKNGDWGKAENLGPTINTAENEESPFISSDGNTLYFSSEGHNSMGGYDVFRSALGRDGSWRKPENMGAPINNGGDDVFYIADEKTNTAYYSTLNRYGEGDLDIYSVTFYPEVQPMAKLRVPAGLFPDGAQLSLRISNADGSEKRFSVSSGDSISYPYVPGSSSVFSFTASGYEPVSDTVHFSASAFHNCFQNIAASGDGKQLKLNSYFFDIDNAVDADTSLELVADRKAARNIYLAQLTLPENIYTAFDRESRDIALTPTGQTAVAGTGTSLSGEEQALALLNSRIAPVLFDFNESFLRDDMKDLLDNACAMLKKDPGLSLSITGHADSQGSDQYNLALSRRRAQAVRNYFIICGIPAERLLVTGEGEKAPAASNATDIGRSQNRRVEIRLVR